MKAFVFAVFVVLVGVFALGVLVGTMRERSAPILCDAGSQTQVNAPDEYPVYALECDNGRRVLLLD